MRSDVERVVKAVTYSSDAAVSDELEEKRRAARNKRRTSKSDDIESKEKRNDSEKKVNSPVRGSESRESRVEETR